MPVLPVRSAPPPTRPGTIVERWPRGTCRWPCGWRPSRPAPSVGRRRSQPGRPVPAEAGVERRRGRRSTRRAASPTPRGRCGPRAPGVAVVGRARRRARRTSRRAGGPRISLVTRTSSSPSGLPWAVVGVGELGRRVADVAAQDDQRRAGPRRPWPAAAPASRASRSLADLAEARRRASRRPRTAWRTSSEQAELGGAVDRDVVVVVDVDEPAEAEVAGQRGGLVADALLEVAVGADHEGVVVARPRGRTGPAASARRCPCPTPLAKPWPSGPVVTSTPAVWCTSGWPGVRRAPLPEVLAGRRG